MSDVQWLDIEEDQAGQRLDNYLMSVLKGVPRTYVYRIIRKGEVRVNKGRISPGYRLEAGDTVRVPPVRLPEKTELPRVSGRVANSLADALLYEDKELMVINKPSGLAVHGGSGIQLGLIESLRQLRPEVRNMELVHRLDRDTSGCVMVAKKRSMLRWLHDRLRDGSMHKIYHALVVGRWPNRKTRVDAPLMKNHLQSGERMVRVAEEGKRSVTEFRVLDRYAGYTLVEASPVTGRTHQIRVHCQYAGYPIVGDPKYGEASANAFIREMGCKRLFLHAAALEIPLPDRDKPLRVEAPMDAELLNLLALLKD